MTDPPGSGRAVRDVPACSTEAIVPPMPCGRTSARARPGRAGRADAPHEAGHPVERCGAAVRQWRAAGVLAAVTLTAPHALSTVLYSVLVAPYRSLAAFSVATRASWKSVVETM